MRGQIEVAIQNDALIRKDLKVKPKGKLDDKFQQLINSMNSKTEKTDTVVEEKPELNSKDIEKAETLKEKKNDNTKESRSALNDEDKGTFVNLLPLAGNPFNIVELNNEEAVKPEILSFTGEITAVDLNENSEVLSTVAAETSVETELKLPAEKAKEEPEILDKNLFKVNNIEINNVKHESVKAKDNEGLNFIPVVNESKTEETPVLHNENMENEVKTDFEVKTKAEPVTGEVKTQVKKEEKTDKKETSEVLENLEVLNSKDRPVKAADVKAPVSETVNKKDFTDTITVKEPEKLHEDLSNYIANHELKDGNVVLKLNPAKLGEIVMTVKHTAEGTLISLACDKAATARILSNNANEMGGIMESHLGEPTQIFVDGKETDYTEQQQNSNSQRQNQEQEQHKGNEENEGQTFVERLRLGLI